MNDRSYIPFHEQTEVKTDFFVRQGSITNYYNDGSDLQYLKMLAPMETYRDSEYRKVSFYLRTDTQHEFLEAKRKTPSSMLAEIGGMYTAIYTIFHFLCSYFTS
jgi:hypothetical protein